MILYFSSTGNCKYIAEQLAAALGDRACSIIDTDRVELPEGEGLGFVFPTYFWRLPSIVDEKMQALLITTEAPAPYIWFVSTYGTTCGGSGSFLRRHLKKKGLTLSASFSIKTVDDWTVLFDVSDKTQLELTLRAEQAQLEEVAAALKSERRGNRMKGSLPMIAVLGSGSFYKRARRTAHLHVSDACIGCGLCARECPTQTIELREGKPRWVKESCTMCLHCLHACPKFAIQYDDKTQMHGQYRHP